MFIRSNLHIVNINLFLQFFFTTYYLIYLLYLVSKSTFFQQLNLRFFGILIIRDDTTMN